MCVLGICSSCVARRASRVAFADVAMLCREYTSRMKDIRIGKITAKVQRLKRVLMKDTVPLKGACPQDCSKLKKKDPPVEWILDPNNRCQRGGEKFDNR
ncbi:PREDICTED: uncharacterized protein LOC107331807 isoform X4 [Acropora digitifera]|uniref:uncharacterized protein LOC107331807 isoform X4 n=1 Tax=Acropora digitifera TaxID=70779 RepID=UPI00077ACD0A|nr:PREDICTED: uncharacterized protein LOC107331807 isoform X4 [Acropora digitifera]